jgi:hypothetical protein
VKRALETAASLATIAAPIVQEIAAITPNTTVAEVAQAYAKYGVAVFLHDSRQRTQCVGQRVAESRDGAAAGQAACG